jgi:signal transduction histidine kinase/CheY-like chemotaxis protein/integral membrane sensor domain MASE1
MAVNGPLSKLPPLASKTQSHPALLNCLTALIYWASSYLGLQLTETYGNISPIWPASGFAVTAIYLGGYALLPGILIGALISYLTTDMGTTSALIVALGNTGEAAIAAWLLSYARKISTQLGQYITPIWIMTTALLAPLPSSAIGAWSTLYLSEYPNALSFWQAMLIWMAGNSLGILIIVPTILSLKRLQFSFNKLPKLLALCVLILSIDALILYQHTSLSLLFLAFIPLIPACRWFGPMGTSLYTLSFVVLSIFIIYTNPETNILASTNYQLYAFDTFLITLAITSLTIATLYNKGQFWIPSLLLLAGWLSSGLIYNTLKNTSDSIDAQNFIELTYDTEAAITARLDTYVNALSAAAGFYINSKDLHPEEWESFIHRLKLVERYPGINGMGFILPVDQAELPAFIAHRHALGQLNFEIKTVPEVTRPPTGKMGYEHYIISYIEPLAQNYQALGLDVASEKKRQTAGQRARDTGKATITDRITLVQDGQSRPGFLMFYPMYYAGAQIETVQERRMAFVGWSYAPFITEEFLNGIVGSRKGQIQFDIYDSPQLKAKHLVYNSQNKDLNDRGSTYAHISKLKVTNQTFSFGWNYGDHFQKHETASATIAAASLALGSCLLVVIVVNLQTTNLRAKRIVQERTLELSTTNNKLKKEVRERQKAELESKNAHIAADSANLAKSEFLATMSHEIRTPMNSVLGFAELLSSSQLNADQRQWTSYIQSSGNSLLRLINDILDFSKIEAGKLELETIPFSINEALNEVACGLAPIASQKELDIQVLVDSALPPTVLGDPIRFKQIVTNLVANSLKFTHEGSIVVAVKWTGDPKHGVANITITDSGIGIPANKLEHLFDRFSQVNRSTTRQYGGTGLGLAICKRIVELMNGQIYVEHTSAKGTTIAFNIPFHSAKPCENDKMHLKVNKPDTKEPSESQTRAWRALVVDDNAVNRKLAATVIRRLGHQTEIASDGTEAIERVKEQFYDIVFLDCQMPVLDGYEATHRIRKLESEGQIPGSTTKHRLPIIALTANASEKDRQACLECGMNSYICKPARIDDFRRAFAQLDDSPRSETT